MNVAMRNSAAFGLETHFGTACSGSLGKNHIIATSKRSGAMACTDARWSTTRLPRDDSARKLHSSSEPGAYSLYGIFGGHGAEGAAAASFCQQHLEVALETYLPKLHTWPSKLIRAWDPCQGLLAQRKWVNSLQSALLKALSELQVRLGAAGLEGACSAVLLLQMGPLLTCASLGNARAVLYVEQPPGQGPAHRMELSVQHSLGCSAAEGSTVQRVGVDVGAGAGGAGFTGVCTGTGALSVSRALGGFALQEAEGALLPLPHIRQYMLPEGLSARAVLASHSIWAAASAQPHRRALQSAILGAPLTTCPRQVLGVLTRRLGMEGEAAVVVVDMVPEGRGPGAAFVGLSPDAPPRCGWSLLGCFRAGGDAARGRAWERKGSGDQQQLGSSTARGGRQAKQVQAAVRGEGKNALQQGALCESLVCDMDVAQLMDLGAGAEASDTRLCKGDPSCPRPASFSPPWLTPQLAQELSRALKLARTLWLESRAAHSRRSSFSRRPSLSHPSPPVVDTQFLGNFIREPAFVPPRPILQMQARHSEDVDCGSSMSSSSSIHVASHCQGPPPSKSGLSNNGPGWLVAYDYRASTYMRGTTSSPLSKMRGERASGGGARSSQGGAALAGRAAGGSHSAPDLVAECEQQQQAAGAGAGAARRSVATGGAMAWVVREQPPQETTGSGGQGERTTPGVTRSHRASICSWTPPAATYHAGCRPGSAPPLPPTLPRKAPLPPLRRFASLEVPPSPQAPPSPSGDLSRSRGGDQAISAKLIPLAHSQPAVTAPGGTEGRPDALMGECSPGSTVRGGDSRCALDTATKAVVMSPHLELFYCNAEKSRGRRLGRATSSVV